jgi:hypothetical protein
LIGLVLLLVTLQLGIDSLWLTVGVLSTIAVIAPFWLATVLHFYRGNRAIIGARLDGLLWLYFLGEMLLVAALYRASTGAWINYAIQAVVFLAVLTARALGRVVEMKLRFRSQALIALAALVCLTNAGSAIRFAELRRRVAREALATFLSKDRCDPSVVFVVDHPGMNRLHGRFDLVYDGWLYPVFESIGLAQPRAVWLRRILTSGTIQFVVNTSEAPVLDGIPHSLPQMGYFRKYQVGPFYVWERTIAAPKVLVVGGSPCPKGRHSRRVPRVSRVGPALQRAPARRITDRIDQLPQHERRADDDLPQRAERRFHTGHRDDLAGRGSPCNIARPRSTSLYHPADPLRRARRLLA